MALHIPASPKTVSVSIVDSTAQVTLPLAMMASPAIKGHVMLRACCFVFLVEHVDAATGERRRVVFDLGVRRNWDQGGFPPALDGHLQALLAAEAPPGGEKASIRVDQDVRDVLAGQGVDPDSIEAVVWGHTHMDHTGNMATFGPETALVVGPGFGTGSCGCHGSQATALAPHIFPGYPQDPDSVLMESDYAGRQLRELADGDFSLVIGGFQAHDYFGDGSFYLLHTPGHAVGHLCGLARVVAASPGAANGGDFVLMGGDAYHHMGELRPSPHVPLPEGLPEGLSEGLLPLLPHGPTQAFYVPAGTKGASLHWDPAEALATIRKLQAFDGDAHVLMVAAHDEHLHRLLAAEGGLFPATANDFVARGWVARSRWLFLKDFAAAL